MSSMAKDGRFGKRSAEGLPGLLRQVAPPVVWRAFHHVSDGCGPRARWSLKQLVLVWLIMGWIQAASLRERFERARRTLIALQPRRRRVGRTYAGLNQYSRRRLPRAAQQFLAVLRPRVQARLRPVWELHGWVVFAVDGTRIEVPRTRANARRLGCAGKDKTGPQFWLTTLVHLPSRVIWDWRIGPGTASERAHLRKLVDSLPPGALLVADAGFIGFDLLSTLTRRAVSFLVRCGANASLLIDGAQAVDRLQAGDRRVVLWPAGQRRRPPLNLRLITLKGRGQRLHLLTNVLASTQLPRRVAGELYRARWAIEVNYRSLKQTLERRRLQARTPGVGAWELAGNVLALTLLLILAAWVHAAQTGHGSPAQLLNVIRCALERLWTGRSTHGLRHTLRAAVYDDYRRRRPKHARDWPHKKHDPPIGAPKLRRMTGRETALFRARIKPPQPAKR